MNLLCNYGIINLIGCSLSSLLAMLSTRFARRENFGRYRKEAVNIDTTYPKIISESRVRELREIVEGYRCPWAPITDNPDYLNWNEVDDFITILEFYERHKNDIPQSRNLA